MILVADTGPIIALAKIGQLVILPKLGFQSVHIPLRVHHEPWGKIGPESAAIDRALSTFVRVTEVPPPPEFIHSKIAGLDQGEQEVLGLATSMEGSVLVLLDDQAGRAGARQLGLPLTGTVGLLLFAKKQGLIAHVLPLLQEARDKGYWLSDAILNQAKQLARE